MPVAAARSHAISRTAKDRPTPRQPLLRLVGSFNPIWSEAGAPLSKSCQDSADGDGADLPPREGYRQPRSLRPVTAKWRVRGPV